MAFAVELCARPCGFGARRTPRADVQGLVSKLSGAPPPPMAAAKKEPWSESANPAKRTLGKIGSALWGLWDAIPA